MAIKKTVSNYFGLSLSLFIVLAFSIAAYRVWECFVCLQEAYGAFARQSLQKHQVPVRRMYYVEEDVSRIINTRAWPHDDILKLLCCAA